MGKKGVRQWSLIVAVLIVGLVIGYATGINRISGLQEQVEGLEAEVAERDETISGLQSSISEKDREISAFEAQVKELEGELAEKDSTIAELSARIEELERLPETKVLGIYFSPRGGCEEQVIYWINRANSSIHILIYSFTLDSISDALIEAHNRGIEVKVVFEKGQITEYSEYPKLKEATVSVRNDTNPRLMHHKVMIVDEVIVLTGSFNWSKSGEERNNENLIVIQSINIASVYEAEFQRIWEISE